MLQAGHLEELPPPLYRAPAANDHGGDASMPRTTGYEVRFSSLFDPGRALTFPCDAQGRVDLDALSERARNNYLYARATVGREHCAPCVCAA